jgi:hypothetical protein
VGNVVVPEPFVHCTTEQRSKFVPVTTRVAPLEPAVALAGETVTLEAAGSIAAVIEKADAFDTTPKLETASVIGAVPTETTSVAGTVAMSCVELTNCVCSAETTGGPEVGVTIQSTIEPLTKFAPVTVTANAAVLHEGVEFVEEVDEDREVTLGAKMAN